MNFENIILEKEGSVAIITLNRPEVLNAISLKLRKELLDALKIAEKDDTVRCILITGAGRAFCSGGDVKEMEKLTASSEAERRERLQILNEVVMCLANMQKPVVAAVNGATVGAGCSLAMACDIVIASEDAKFSQAFVNVALIPDTGGTFFLPRLVGVRKAKELVFTGEMIDARKACELGMVNRVVAAGSLMNVAREFAMKLANGPTKTIGLAKIAINKGLISDLRASLDYEKELQNICFLSEDHKEGVVAFKEKRKTRFKGR